MPQTRRFKSAPLHSLISAALAAAGTAVWADDIRTLPGVEVVGSRYSLLGAADTANEGAAGQAQIDKRVVARTGEVLEVVPGLIVSQHRAKEKPISTSCAASIWITDSISRCRWMACPSISAATHTGKAGLI